jgi:hypothetical protein
LKRKNGRVDNELRINDASRNNFLQGCSNVCEKSKWEDESMSTLLMILLVLLLVGSLPTWPYSSGWGYYPAGGLGVVLVVMLVLLLFNGRTV